MWKTLALSLGELIAKAAFKTFGGEFMDRVTLKFLLVVFMR
jgi:hypothetical protein